ncbi:pyridoxal phosphate-dependent aminotransferase [Kitasatospora sp. NPDC101157]|uniref:pyridoxal phosphate-dependent aminotransferase n=1 Tax=Kitasatospora sp. NPDC101157 TaxID=3364098 RepID=UPI00381FF5EF
MNPSIEHGADTVNVYQRMTALAAGSGAVNLSQGIPEPVYDPEWRDAVAAELPRAHFQYTPTAGQPVLREAVAALYPDRGDGTSDPVVTSGCTESLASVLLALAGSGSETVVWLDPGYSYYPGLARTAGLRSRSVPIDLSGPSPRLDTGRLVEALAPLGRRGVLLLNSPHNPSGLVLDREAWSEVIELTGRYGCQVVVDDVYRDFRYRGPAVPYRELLATGRAAVAGAVSKSYAASGVRLGWFITSDGLARRAETAHMHLSNCAPDLLQRAAARVLRQVDGARLTRTTESYRRKRDHLLAALNGSGFTTIAPDGGHFVMARPPRGTLRGSDPAVELARAAGVAALPLDSFFARPEPSWLRLSFAVAEDQVATAARRLGHWHPAPPPPA